MADDLAFLTASEALGRLRCGDVTAEMMTRACLDRIAARDGEVRAWTHVDPDLALRQARELDRAGPTGSLHGLPVAIKDVILTRDMPTQYNSPIYRGDHPRIDAACVTLLRAAGTVILGKTDTVEFAATGRRALTRNPRDLRRTPGGSSSGSAAAVADFHAPLALGTQTAGSTIRPASFCGVWGFKPTWGLVSREGAKTYAPSLDTIGWFARSAADLALIYDVFDPDSTSTLALDLRKVRIAVCRTPQWDHAEAGSKAALTAGTEMLHASGAEVSNLDLPTSFNDLAAQQILIMRAEGRSAFLPEYRTRPELLGASIREQVQNVDGYTRADQLRAYDLAARCRAEFDTIAASFDAVLTLSAVGEAPQGLASVGEPTFNGIWTLLHVPCVNVPGFIGPGGLPIGLTLTGRRFLDRGILAAAMAIGDRFAE